MAKKSPAARRRARLAAESRAEHRHAMRFHREQAQENKEAVVQKTLARVEDPLVVRMRYKLDVDGNRKISRGESGLSAEEFSFLDLDDSGSLKAWEIRRAVALGALD